MFRVHVLEGAGLDVVFPRTKQEAIAAIIQGGYDVALVSYSLPNDTAEELVELVRQNCQKCSIVAISETGWDDNKLQPDVTVSAEDGPVGMLEAIAKVKSRGLRRVK